MTEVFNQITLQRYPLTSDKTLKAWNAADEYLISNITSSPLTSEPSGSQTINEKSHVLVINDQFGAITCSLSRLFSLKKIHYWTDSFLSMTAIEKNIQNNKLKSKIEAFTPTEYHQKPTEEESVYFDFVIIRIPKHNSLLEHQLQSISGFINDKSTIIAAGMTKEIHKSTLSIFEKQIGVTKTSLAKKKARLIYSKVDQTKTKVEKKEAFKCYNEEKYGVTSYGLAGVFSRESLDIGSRVLLNYLPDIQSNQKVIDLGCGTGILGTSIAIIDPSVEITFCDESFLAIESAKLTYNNNIVQLDSEMNGGANYLVTDVLEGLKNNHYDHILCNPPFHQQNVQTLSIANKMFKQSALKMKESGELRVVANRHLKYQPMLNQYFEKVKIISNDSKFIVWLAMSPKG